MTTALLSFDDAGRSEKDLLAPAIQSTRRQSVEHRRRRVSLCVLLLINVLLVLAYVTSLFNPRSLLPSDLLEGGVAFSPSNEHNSNPVHKEEPPEKAIILASYEGQDIEWLHTVPPDWKVIRMIVDGREAYAYLTFILENYESLPKYMIFIHGHMRAWHQIEPIPWKVRALNLTSLDREGYINLRCSHDSGCTEDTILGAGHPWIEFAPLRDIVGNMMERFWEVYLRPFGFGDHPKDLGQPCCAQFAVTRDAVLLRSRDFYVNYRDPLEWSLERGRSIFGFNWDNYHSGTLYEYLWHVVFGKASLLCPDESICRQEYFSDAIACEKYPGRYQFSFGWRSINCTSIYEAEMEKEETSRLTIEEVWSPSTEQRQ